MNDAAIEVRKQRGLAMAETFRIVQKGEAWSVPSSTGNGRYSVRLNAEYESCTCPDFELTGCRCKHIHAVEVVIQKKLEFGNDGSVTETQSVQVTKTRKTYKQDWTAYNAAQTEEKERFQILLSDLCSNLTAESRRGHPTIPPSDALFACVFKVYSTLSGRRFMTDLREAKKKGYIGEAASYNTISRYLEKPELTPLLREMIIETSKPLKAIEKDFAVDSSGFTTCRFTRWFDHKYGVTHQQHDWVKTHCMVGVKTNVVTAIEIEGRHTCDITQFVPLVKATAQNFKIAEVSADKLYATVDNISTVGGLDATPFIAFMKRHSGKAGGLWEKMFHYFQYRREEFLGHYHKRSNIESTFSMIKRKFGDSLRSKTDTAMVNETYAKVLCHNIVVLIHEMHELGIDPVFWQNDSTTDNLAAV